MKKFLALLLSLCIFLCLAACQKPNNNPDGSSDILNGQSTPTTPDSNNAENGGENTGSSLGSSPNDMANDTTPNTQHTHNYTSAITKAATCIEAGTKTFSCACGHSYSESIGSIGHRWGNWTTTKQPTTSSEGNSQRKCTVCDAVENKAIAKLPDNSPVAVTDEQLRQIENGFLNLVNTERSRLGAAPLAINNHLDSAAQTRSTEIISVFSHTRPNGEPYYSLVENSPYDFSACAENICMTTHKGNDYISKADKWTGSATQIEAAYSTIFLCFKNSPGHYQNIKNPEYEDCGIGIRYVLDNDYGVPVFYVAHIFGTEM